MLSFWFGEMGRDTLLLWAVLLLTAAQGTFGNPLLNGAFTAIWGSVYILLLTRLAGRAFRRERWLLVGGVVLLTGLRVASAQDPSAPLPRADLGAQIAVSLTALSLFIGAVNQTVDLIIKPFVNATIPPTAEMDYWRGWLLRGVAALIGVFAAFLMQFNAFAFVQVYFPQISTNLLIIVTGSTAALGSQGLHRVATVAKQIIDIWVGRQPDAAGIPQ